MDPVAAASDSDFLQFSYSYRCDIYKKIGIISDQPIRDDHNLASRLNHEKREFNTRFFHTSNRDLLADAWSAFWSENKFVFYDIEELSSLGTPAIWSSLKYLEVHLTKVYHLRNADRRLSCWRQVCIDLGTHSPPSSLMLISSSNRGAWIGQPWQGIHCVQCRLCLC